MLLHAFLLHLLHVCAIAELFQWPLNPSTARTIREDDPHPKEPGKRVPVPSLFFHKYSEQTFIGTHNSVAIRTAENGWSLSGNQYFDVLTQLDSGVRLLQAQGHKSANGSSEVRLCHFNCALMDGGSLHDFLTTVRRWLEAHPNEVVTLLFVNTGIRLSKWARTYYETGLDLLSYVPPVDRWDGSMRTEDWPTIADMVATNSRVVTFLSNGADQSIIPYFLPEFNYLFETNFGIEKPEEYSCLPARPRWPGTYVPNRMSLVNHFLYAKFLGFRYPNASYANTTNAAGFAVGELGEHAVRCRTWYDRRPNFFLVDFFNEGDVFDVEHGMNLT